MPENIAIDIMLPVSPERLYTAWLDSAEHSAFTNMPAQIDPSVGGAFTTWDGFIHGTNRILEPYRRIVQTWRTQDFPPDLSDSEVELLFEDLGNGFTRLVLRHTGLPDGTAEAVEESWLDHYFDTMLGYFSGGTVYL